MCFLCICFKQLCFSSFRPSTFLRLPCFLQGSGEIISALGLMVTVVMWLEGRFEKMDIKADTQYANLMAILMQLREDNAERRGEERERRNRR